MATHNQVRVVGFLLKDPSIINEGIAGSEKILFQIRTVRRMIEGYNDRMYEDVLVYYDGEELMHQLKPLKKFDVVDIKGVFNVLTVNKKSRCPHCATVNVKERGSSTFVYPICIHKRGSFKTDYDKGTDQPEAALCKHYMEVSNQILIIGTVVKDPVLVENVRYPCCRYMLGVDRKYFVKTQTEQTADYPWVYSYGQQAEWDSKHLLQSSVILVDAFMRSREVEVTKICDGCEQEYSYKDVMTEFIPYSIEYLSGYKTDEEIAREAEIAKRQMIREELGANA